MQRMGIKRPTIYAPVQVSPELVVWKTVKIAQTAYTCPGNLSDPRFGVFTQGLIKFINARQFVYIFRFCPPHIAAEMP